MFEEGKEYRVNLRHPRVQRIKQQRSNSQFEIDMLTIYYIDDKEEQRSFMICAKFEEIHNKRIKIKKTWYAGKSDGKPMWHLEFGPNQKHHRMECPEWLLSSSRKITYFPYGSK